jgi:hypothetical protein
VLPVGSLVSDFATGGGFIAASIAICGFIGQIKPALAREGELEVRAGAGIGGLSGLAFALAVIGADYLLW